MKKLLFLVLAVICFAPCTQIAAMEHSTTQNIPNNQIWYTSSDGNVVTPNETYVFGATIKSNTYSNGKGVITFDGDVTMIGKFAFNDCRNLTSITIPDSVTSIGNEAFYYCYRLTSVNIPDSVTTIGEWAFAYCTSLTSVNIPDSVTSIGDSAFSSCYSLTSVNIPDSVTEIGSSAFSSCKSLTSVNIPDSVTTIGESAFYNCDSLTEFTGKFAEDNGRILIIDGVLTAFAPAGITEYTIPNSVTTIGEYTFRNCKSLTSVNIPDSVTTIGAGAFYNCDSLTSVNISDSVTTIGEWAFRDCTSLTSVNIPNSVTSIGSSAFYSCKSLTSMNIPDSVTSIGSSAFSSCDSLTSVNIPNSVTSIGEHAFAYCTSLTEFTGKFAEDNGRILVVDGVLTAFAPAGITQYTIPDSVTTIGYSAFEGCTSLTSVTIGDSVTSIGYAAFAYCTSLTSVNIPNSVTTIREYAFCYCESLKKVYCYATIPPALVSNAFTYNASGRRIYVYEECVELYKSAWSSYKDSIYTNGQNCPDTTTIEYTTNDGNTITSSKLPIISNIYENGVGILVFSGKEIPSLVFHECTSLTSVTIGDSVTSIGYAAFAYCNSLTSVYCKAITPPSLGYDVFYDNGSGRKIYVPAESVEAYKSAKNWSGYKSAIVGYDFEKGVVVE